MRTIARIEHGCKMQFTGVLQLCHYELMILAVIQDDSSLQKKNSRLLCYFDWIEIIKSLYLHINENNLLLKIRLVLLFLRKNCYQPCIQMHLCFKQLLPFTNFSHVHSRIVMNDINVVDMYNNKMNAILTKPFERPKHVNSTSKIDGKLKIISWNWKYTESSTALMFSLPFN